jgi:hypothetical protein
MQKRSKLAALPPADQELVLNLCEHNRYEDVVPILAKPRAAGGLDLQTSRSALSRFVASQPHPDRLDREVKKLLPFLNSPSASANPPIHSQLPEAIRTLVERHIFSLLAAGEPFGKIAPLFRILFKLDKQKNHLPPANNCIYPPVCGTNPTTKPPSSRISHISHQKNAPKNLVKNSLPPLA